MLLLDIWNLLEGRLKKKQYWFVWLRLNNGLVLFGVVNRHFECNGLVCNTYDITFYIPVFSGV